MTSGCESMDHLIIDLEAESESESNRPLASGMQNLSSDTVSCSRIFCMPLLG